MLKPPPKQLSQQRAHRARLSDREQSKRDERRGRAIAEAKRHEAERRRQRLAKKLAGETATATMPTVPMRITQVHYWPDDRAQFTETAPTYYW